METTAPVTYLYPGHEETTFIAETPSRRQLIRIPFRGGNLTCGQPAHFTTTRPIVIRSIERSNAFRQGRIIRINQHG